MATKMSLKLREPEKGIYVLHVPSALFGTDKKVRVHGTMNGLRFRAAALLHAAGEYVIAMSESTREQLGVMPGETVNVELDLEIDEAPRLVARTPKAAAPVAKKPAAETRKAKPAKTRAVKTAKKSAKKPAAKQTKNAAKKHAKKAPAKSTKTKTKKKR